ncbi:hypothetical protein [Nocardioides sp. CFH 31398]|uniref:hypothetical protein n=1 Tax=Nocardioides sp. CFH 31398 TaxID=2919579 RepID=UPI001F06AD46|nr:hypothetical protein [Nocardioides sp. CFH 31398]MCH1867732.1 hypothetical protein [Nocardioides sp. CFH 31398]
MFTHHCTACERRQLMFVRQISDVAPVADGLEVSFTCWCGAEQTGVLDDLTAGSTRAPQRALAAA